MIIGYEYENPSTIQTEIFSSSFTVISTTSSTPQVSFTAPNNGKVIIEAQLYVSAEISEVVNDPTTTLFESKRLSLALSQSTATGSHDTDTERRVFINSQNDLALNEQVIETIINTEWLITGLTPGVNYTYYIHKGSSGASTDLNIYWGSFYPPIILKAMTAP